MKYLRWVKIFSVSWSVISRNFKILKIRSVICPQNYFIFTYYFTITWCICRLLLEKSLNNGLWKSLFIKFPWFIFANSNVCSIFFAIYLKDIPSHNSISVGKHKHVLQIQFGGSCIKNQFFTYPGIAAIMCRHILEYFKKFMENRTKDSLCWCKEILKSYAWWILIRFVENIF